MFLFFFTFFCFSYFLFFLNEDMTLTTRFRAGSPALAGLAAMDLLQNSKSLVAEAIQELKLKLKDELDLMIKKQIALREDFRIITEGFDDWLFAIKGRIYHHEWSHLPCRSKVELSKEFITNLGALSHDVYQ